MCSPLRNLLLLLCVLISNAFSFTSLGNLEAFTSRAPTGRGRFVPAPSVTVKRTALSFCRSRRRLVITAGWGPDPVWETCTVLSSSPVSKNCVNLTVEVTSQQGKEYKVPGQYCQVKIHDDIDAKPIFLAIASPPLDDPELSGDYEEEKKEEELDVRKCEFEFLVKRTDNNGWIADASAGTKVDVSQVLGSGFPMKENLEGFKYDFPTQNVLLFAAGSGIAPIRAVIESGQLNISPAGQGGRTCRLYYGIRNPEEMPYSDRFTSWEASGVEVVPVMSQPEGTEWAGRTGYVQTALEEDGIPIPRNSGALMCGMKGMTEAVKDLLTRSGVFEGRVLTNF